jgi:hypothetical protein
MKKVVRLTESDLIKMVKNIVNEQGMFDEPSQIEIMAKKLIPNINIVNNSVFLDGQMVFHSSSQQCVEAFLYGMLIAKSKKY